MEREAPPAEAVPRGRGKRQASAGMAESGAAAAGVRMAEGPGRTGAVVDAAFSKPTDGSQIDQFQACSSSCLRHSTVGSCFLRDRTTRFSFL